MNRFRQSLTKSLGFRIITPVILVTLLVGLNLYLFVLRSVSEFAEDQIGNAFLQTSNEITAICSKNSNEPLKTGGAEYEEEMKKRKELSVRAVEDFMKQNRLYGSITEDAGELLSFRGLSPGLSEAIEKTAREREVRVIKHLGERYYAYHFRFEPWGWHIVLVHHAAEYSALLKNVRIAYGVTGIILLCSAFLLLYYFNRTIEQPISRIIRSIRKGEKPDYSGISEFEFLSNGLRDSIVAREKENSMLNNIYHIAISRRGEEFFDEVAIAIWRMFGLNSLIARVGPDGENADVTVMYLGGELIKGITVSLKGTPCEGVVQKKHMNVLERDAYREYPGAKLLTDNKAESYIGLAIFDRRGEVVGVVNAFGREREFTESDIKVFQTIGQMVAIEFEMIEKEKTEQRMREELFQAQKMEAVGTLAGGIAHDFNNMLQGILGYASLLKMKISADDPLHRPLDVIENSAEKAAELTKQLLGFARKGKYIVEPLNLNILVEEVLSIITRTFDRAIEIRTTFSEDIWTIDGDRGQIEHVILNLCLNARDAMPGGGRLHIETSNVEWHEGETPYPWAKPGKYAAVRVSDTGTGMDEEVRRHIFEPFYTTKERGKGTGMGLAMVYGVVKNHDGFVTVDSEMGRGSTFSVFLPAVEKEAKKEEIEEKNVPSGKGTILVVDDEDFIRDFARETLERLGYRVLEASDGREAIRIYAARKADVNLVILDLIMPKMGGDETFRKLKEIDPSVKVLISSGYGLGDGIREMMKDEGIAGFIQKPYNIAEIAEMTKAALSSA